MPSVLRAHVEIAEISRDLRALGDDFDKPIRDTLEEHATKIADIARGFMRHGEPSWPNSSAARDFGSAPGTIAGYYDSRVATTSASIGSRHPAAPVWEWGGDIHPAAGSARHAAIAAKRVNSPARKLLEAGVQTIHIPRLQPVHRAGEADLPAMEQALDDAVSRLVEQYGF